MAAADQPPFAGESTSEGSRPLHVAIVMDGNGRWAKQRGLPRSLGHRAGVGAPFFTTDSGAALRAAEMGCEALFKGTSVDGVYTADPKTDPAATRYETLSYHEVLAKNLKVMDASAVSLMRENHIPIVVFNIRERGNLLKVLKGDGVFTTIA